MELGLAPDQSRNTFSVMQSQATLAESLGYTTLWTHEHHSHAMMYPDPLMALAAVAPVTSTIRLGTSMLLLPIHHPVRVAQAAAMLDVLSGGRVCLGVANGYSAEDLATFGVPSARRGRRLSAGLQLLRDLWSGKPVTAAGDDFTLQDFVLFPKPVQKAGPPLYVGGHADVAIRRAADMGDNFFISTTASFDMVRDLISRYREFMREGGRPFDGVYLNRILCVTGNAKETASAREFYSRALLRLYDGWGHENVTRLTAEQRSTEYISRANLIVGEATHCHERILEYQELGVGHIACLTNFGSPPVDLMQRSILLAGEKIIPRL